MNAVDIVTMSDAAIDEQIEPKTYEFDELSDKAKERAREKFREHHLDYDWWEHVYSEAKTVAKLFGMEIGERAEAHGNRHGTRTVYSPDIRFNGFYSQGSGACWSGSIYVDKLAGAVERVKQFAPNDNELMLMAQLSEKLHAEIMSVVVFNRLAGDDVNRDWPDVEANMRLIVNGNDRNWTTSIDGSDVSNDIEKIADELVDDFGGWIHSQLEGEYEYQMADEQIDEAINANAMLFDEDGNAQ